jgi:UDP-N-acetylglucosamine transferase subunit ALG13
MINLFRKLATLGHKIVLLGENETGKLASKFNIGFWKVEIDARIKNAVSQKLSNTEFYTKFAFPMAKEQIPEVINYCNTCKPDLLLGNTRVFSGIVTSIITGIPIINHCYSGDSLAHKSEDLYGFCVNGSENERKNELMLNMSNYFYEKTDIWFNKNIGKPFGLPEIQYAVSLASEECVLVLSIPELCKPCKVRLPYVHFIGNLMAPIDDSDTNFSSNKKYCYVSLGTWPVNLNAIVELYRIIVKSIPVKYNIVIGLGGILTSGHLNLNDSRVFVYNYAPQISIIRNASFVVCHGGSNTVHEALYFGKPIIGFPFQAEHRELLFRLEMQKAGIVVDLNRSIEKAIKKAVREITVIGKYKENAYRLSNVLRHINGEKKAIELINYIVSKKFVFSNNSIN